MASTVESNSDAFCEYCIGINLQLLKSSLGYEHRPTFESLILSSSTCALCAVIVQSVHRTLEGHPALHKSIDGNTGPVYLVCAGRSLAGESKLHRRRPDGPVEEFLLWRDVAVTIGQDQDRSRCFSSFGAQLTMVAVKGKLPQMQRYPDLIVSKAQLQKRLASKPSK
jgi:hypothetical protein